MGATPAGHPRRELSSVVAAWQPFKSRPKLRVVDPPALCYLVHPITLYTTVVDRLQITTCSR
jgi:hypothetical protein